MHLRKSAWWEAAWIFLCSRAVIFLVTGITILRDEPDNQSNFWLAWQHWDVYSYIGIAMHGYGSFRDTVFFPLWPLLLRGLGTFFGNTVNGDYLAGMLLANLFFYLALVLFYFLVNQDFDATTARNALFYLAFSAYAIFFFVGYTESLFLFLCLAAFLCLRYARYWLAGLCGMLLSLTHSQGVLLLIPFVVLISQRYLLVGRAQRDWPRLIRSALPLLLIPAGIALFMLYLWRTMGTPLAFSIGEAQSWGRHLTFPLKSLLLVIQTFSEQQSMGIHELNALDLIFTLLPLAILALGWRKIPLHYALFALAVALLNMSYPQGKVEPLTATPRYMLMVFPVFVILGLWGKNRYVDRLIVALSLTMFVLLTLLYVKHEWVA